MTAARMTKNISNEEMSIQIFTKDPHKSTQERQPSKKQPKNMNCVFTDREIKWPINTLDAFETETKGVFFFSMRQKV